MNSEMKKHIFNEKVTFGLGPRWNKQDLTERERETETGLTY